MSPAALFFIALGVFILFVCVLGIMYQGGPEQLLDWSANRVAQRRAAADALDLESMLEATNRHRRAEGLPPLSDEELQRAIAEDAGPGGAGP